MSALKGFSAAALLAGIAGCSTAPGLLEQAPESFDSSKSVQQVAVCLSQAWTQRNKVVRVLPTETGQRIVIDNPVNHGVIAIVELAAAPAGTSVRYWKGAGLTGWTRDDLEGLPGLIDGNRLQSCRLHPARVATRARHLPVICDADHGALDGSAGGR